MKSEMIFVVVVLILMAALLMGISGYAQPEPATTSTATAAETTTSTVTETVKPITLRLQSHMPATHDFYLKGLTWAKMITLFVLERVDGRCI